MMTSHEYITERDGTKVIGTSHFNRRLRQRMLGMSEQQLESMLQSILIHCHQHKDQFAALPYNSEIFFYVPRFQRGMILAHRRDTRVRGSDQHHWVLITVYPYGCVTPVQPDTLKVTVH